MTDVDFRVGALRTGDLVVEAGDVRFDAGLVTAVLISIFSDGRAPEDEELPDGTANRRGWWAQQLLEGEATRGFGSLLWLQERAKLTNDVLNEAEDAVRAALDWLIVDDVAEEVEVTATRVDQDQLQLQVVIRRGVAQAFAEAWEGFRDEVLEVGPNRVKILAA